MINFKSPKVKQTLRTTSNCLPDVMVAEASSFVPCLAAFEERINDHWPSPAHTAVSNHIQTLREEIDPSKSINKDESSSGSDNLWTIPGPSRPSE